MCGNMDGWMNKWMSGQRMNLWMDGWFSEQVDRCMKGLGGLSGWGYMILVFLYNFLLGYMGYLFVFFYIFRISGELMIFFGNY